MHKTKHYRRKNKRVRRTKKNQRKSLRRRSMKGGSVIPFADITDSMRTLSYGLTKGINSAIVAPASVAPNKVGGDNPLPFEQSGPASNINDFNYKI